MDGCQKQKGPVISIDTNLLFFAYAEDRPEHSPAKAFLNGRLRAEDVVLSEFVLIEFYRLLRNPAVLTKPLSPGEAAKVIDAWRSHPHWQIAGFAADSKQVHDDLWKHAGRAGFAARRIFDARLALVLRQFGVTEFATANVKDFEGFGFQKVWNPLEE